MKSLDTLLTTVLVIYLMTGVVIRLTNPGMTETQLLINFWPYWSLVLPLIGLFWLATSDKG